MKILPVTLFRKLVVVFRWPPVTLKPPVILNVHRRPISEKESRNRNLMRLSEQSLEISNMFSKNQAETFNLFSSLTRQAKNLKSISACTKKKWFYFIGLQKKYLWWPVPLRCLHSKFCKNAHFAQPWPVASCLGSLLNKKEL